MSRKEEAPEAWPSGRTTQTPTDPLRDELIRCQALGEAGPRDPACLRAWAENRNRFLAPGARPAERLPEMPPAHGDSALPPLERTDRPEIGRAHVCTPVTNAQLVCRLLLEKNKKQQKINSNMQNKVCNTENNKHQHRPIIRNQQ